MYFLVKLPECSPKYYPAFCHVFFFRLVGVRLQLVAVITKEGNHLQSLQLLRFTRDVFIVNLVLLGGDVLQNPGPVRIQCFNCHKTIRKNQGRADCSVCLQSYHLKCLGVDFESSQKCSLCSVSGMEFGGESGVEYTDFNIATELNEAIKLRGMKFIHQNIRSIRGKF